MSPIQSEEASQDVDSARRELIDLTLAYVNALRHRLRCSDPSDDLRRYIADASGLAPIQSYDNISVAIAARIALFRRCRRLITVLGYVQGRILLGVFGVTSETLRVRPLVVFAPISLLPHIGRQLRIAHGAFLFGDGVLHTPPAPMVVAIVFVVRRIGHFV